MLKLAVSFLLTANFSAQGFLVARGESPPPGYLVSATYCSDAWVVNFWNSESSRMDEELAQIRSDGFNSIILVVPWREFQPQTRPARYNPYAFEKLGRVMAAARRQDLWVVVRLGYTWDYYSDVNVLERYQSLLYKDGGTQDAWLDYAGKVYEEVSRYPNFYGGFITWEDFWNFTDTAGSMGHGEDSVRLAGNIGYQDYLADNYQLETASQIYQSEFDSFSKFYLPLREEHAYQLFFGFYDVFLQRLLAQTQAVFPKLSMEVRLDIDPVTAADGQNRIGVTHHSTFHCGEADFTAAMYAAPMGFPAGQELHAAETIESLKQQLLALQAHNEGKPIFLDQFLYMDETAAYAHNARLAAAELPGFLERAVPVLGSMTMGYGVWTYRNYTDNMVYNWQFGLGAKGWDFPVGGAVEPRGGSNAARLPGGAVLSQDLSARLNHGGDLVRVRFTADSDAPVELAVSIGGVTKTMAVDGEQLVDLDFGQIGGGTVSFQSTGNVWIDDVHVFSFEQDGQLYGLEGQELSCIDAMRRLNLGSAAWRNQ